MHLFAKKCTKLYNDWYRVSLYLQCDRISNVTIHLTTNEWKSVTVLSHLIPLSFRSNLGIYKYKFHIKVLSSDSNRMLFACFHEKDRIWDNNQGINFQLFLPIKTKKSTITCCKCERPSIENKKHYLFIENRCCHNNCFSCFENNKFQCNKCGS